MKQLDRITMDPTVMGGKPCIRGMRVTVGTVVGLMAAGKAIEEVLAAYPYIEREDVLQSRTRPGDRRNRIFPWSPVEVAATKARVLPFEE